MVRFCLFLDRMIVFEKTAALADKDTVEVELETVGRNKNYSSHYGNHHGGLCRNLTLPLLSMYWKEVKSTYHRKTCTFMLM